MLARLAPPVRHTAGKKLGLKLGAVARSGDLVLHVAGLRLNFGAREIFSDLELTLQRGDRLALMGKNGVGKTSFLRLLTGELKAEGTIRLGANVKLAYFAQEHIRLGTGESVLAELRQAGKSTDPELRDLAARFGFRGEEVFKPLRALSGGERSRLALAELFLTEGNLLLLDEPTNHLDIATREALEEMLVDFQGTVLIVSHDRYFLNRVATKVAELTPAGLRVFDGDYESYHSETAAAEDTPEADAVPESSNDWEEGRRLRRETQKQEKRRQQLEEFITFKEAELLAAETDLAEAGADYAAAVRHYGSVATIKQELETAWEELYRHEDT
jgi:ATP-binding cassette subfamily F protein 3